MAANGMHEGETLQQYIGLVDVRQKLTASISMPTGASRPAEFPARGEALLAPAKSRAEL